MRLPDTSHLAPEDAELVRALYLERNRVPRSELDAVRFAAELAQAAEHTSASRHARHAA